MHPNPDFLTAWQQTFPDTDEPLIVVSTAVGSGSSSGVVGGCASHDPPVCVCTAGLQVGSPVGTSMRRAFAGESRTQTAQQVLADWMLMLQHVSLLLTMLHLCAAPQAGYSSLVDTSDGFDGWVASKLPVQT